MSARVRKYEATVYYRSTGSSHTREYAFTEAHAREDGVCFEPDGLDLEVAKRLCARWSQQGDRGAIRYTYRVWTF